MTYTNTTYMESTCGAGLRELPDSVVVLLLSSASKLEVRTHTTYRPLDEANRPPGPPVSVSGWTFQYL
jgi:hypothetical protein